MGFFRVEVVRFLCPRRQWLWEAWICLSMVRQYFRFRSRRKPLQAPVCSVPSFRSRTQALLFSFPFQIHSRFLLFIFLCFILPFLTSGVCTVPGRRDWKILVFMAPCMRFSWKTLVTSVCFIEKTEDWPARKHQPGLQWWMISKRERFVGEWDADTYKSAQALDVIGLISQSSSLLLLYSTQKVSFSSQVESFS